MKDCLETIAQIQNALLIACAALLIFVCSPDDTSQYRVAQQTLAHLRIRGPSSGFADVIRVADSVRRARAAYVKARVGAALHRNPLRQRLSHDAIADVLARMTGEPGILQQPASAHLDDIQTFARALLFYYRYAPRDADSAIAAFEQRVPSTCHNCDWEFDEGDWDFISSESPVERDTQVVETSLSTLAPDTAVVRVLTTVIHKSERPDASLAEGPHTYPISARYRLWQDVRFAAALDSALFPMWLVLSRSTAAEATQYIQDHLERSERVVDTLGLKIDAGLVGVGGPVLLIALLSYLALHIRHAATITPNDANILATYPWAPLYQGVTGWASCVLIFIALPSSVSILIVRRTLTSNGSGWPVGLAVLVPVAGLAATWLASTLRAQTGGPRA